MVTVLVNVPEQTPLKVLSRPVIDRVGIEVTHEVTMYFEDKTHAQVWLNDALRQVNDIQEPVVGSVTQHLPQSSDIPAC